MFRYPGVKPFEKKDQKIFFGRTKDIDDLYELILLEKLVVFYGKSGYGKSSLLNAGIIPRFLEDQAEAESYFPISIRFGAHQEVGSISPLSNLQRSLADKCELNPEGQFLNTGDSLWFQFKRRQFEQEKHFLLIFDQFEEFFTYPAEQQAKFQQELAEVLYKGIPQSIRDNLDNYQKEERQFLSKKIDVKVVFAIRSDRMSELDKLRAKLPAILNKRYELSGLTARQAEEAILMPALLEDLPQAPFSSAPFSYDQAAINLIIQELSKGDIQNEGTVEAFQLQILCQYVENEVIAGNIITKKKEELPIVLPKDLPDISNVYETYYRGQLAKLTAEEQEAAHELIEYGLLYDDAQKGEARRLSVDGDALVQQYSRFGASYDLLEKLENTFLLRREINTLGGYNYELCHDTLIIPVLKSKREREIEKRRVEEEKKAKAEETRRQALEEAERRQEAERLQKAAEKGRKKAVFFAGISSVLLIVAIALAIFAFNERSKVLFERKEKNRLNFEILHQRAVVILGAGGCPIDIFKEMEDIVEENGKDAELNIKINDIIARMQTLDCL